MIVRIDNIQFNLISLQDYTFERFKLEFSGKFKKIGINEAWEKLSVLIESFKSVNETNIVDNKPVGLMKKRKTKHET